MEETGASSTRVFISYSREDMAFADEIVDGLKIVYGFDVTIDRHSIRQGEDWKKRLGALIAEADTIVFILSPTSVQSQICQWEVDEAERLGKRFVPALYRDLESLPAPPQLAAINYVDFTSGRTLITGLEALAKALRVDQAWLNEATRLLLRAQEWDAAERKPNRMLSGDDIASAKRWLASTPKGAEPTVTELHRDYIRASDEADSAARDAEVKRQREFAAAEQARARAEEERAKEQAARAEAEEEARAAAVRAQQRTMVGLVAALVLAAVAISVGVYAFKQQEVARDEAKRARLAQAISDSRGEEIRSVIRQMGTELGRPWPPDAISPDYAHLSRTPLGRKLAGQEFVVTLPAIELLIRHNNFQPTVLNSCLVVALRGAEIVKEKYHPGATEVSLRDVRPDHENLRSVILVLNRETGQMHAFTGSTVPSLRLIKRAIAHGGQGANLMPTGSYKYVVGFHGHRHLPGNLRQNEPVATRRTADNAIYEIIDRVSTGTVFNNMHPSYRSDGFSSAGSITIPGRQDRSDGQRFTGEIAEFRSALGLATAPDLTSDHGREVGVLLFTGLDASIASHLAGSALASQEDAVRIHLERIRFGSTGIYVGRLQQALGVAVTKRMDPHTILALAKRQLERLGWWDGLYSPALDAQLGFCVYSQSPCDEREGEIPN